MPDFTPRLFSNDAEVRRIGAGLLSCHLPRSDWTHEAHIAACGWLIRERSEITPELEMPGIIRAYNESVGGINDDMQGYHETITQNYISAVRRQLASCADDLALYQAVNIVLQSPAGKRDWLLQYYSKDLLFSVDARRRFIPPDLRQLPTPTPN